MFDSEFSQEIFLLKIKNTTLSMAKKAINNISIISNEGDFKTVK